MMKHSGRLVLGLSFAVATPVECKSEKSKKEKKGNFIRPSQLPVYENPEDLYSYEYIGKEKSKFEEGVSVARKELQSAYETTSDVRDRVQQFYQTGKAHTRTTFDYVLDEENVPAKIGAISVGGLLGLLIGGRRKGIIKKLFYTAVGATGTAAFVYPKESKIISRELYENAGDYSVIAYNFIAGVKPQGENQTPSSKQESQKAKNVAPKTSSTEVSASIGNSVDSFQSFARQASDVTVWGFRLFNWNDVSSSTQKKKCSVVAENVNGLSDYQNGNRFSTKFDEKSDIYHNLEESALNDKQNITIRKPLSTSLDDKFISTKYFERNENFKIDKTDNVDLRTLEPTLTSETSKSQLPDTQLRDTGQEYEVAQPCDTKSTYNCVGRKEYIDKVSDVLIDSVLTLRIFDIQDTEGSKAETVLINPESESKDDLSVISTKSNQQKSFQTDDNDYSTDSFYNFTDALIDSMLNLKIISVEGEGEEEEEEEETKGGSHIAQTNDVEDCSTSDISNETQFPINNNNNNNNNKNKKFWHAKLKNIFKRSERKNEGEEKNIDEMDSKYMNVKEEEDEILRDTAHVQNDEENLEPISDDEVSCVPQISRKGEVPLECKQNLDLMKSSSVTQPSQKENNNKDVIVSIPKAESANTPSEAIPKIKGDVGQSNPEDKDMYTTRS